MKETPKPKQNRTASYTSQMELEVVKGWVASARQPQQKVHLRTKQERQKETHVLYSISFYTQP